MVASIVSSSNGLHRPTKCLKGFHQSPLYEVGHMIFQQINKYPEPAPATTYHSQQVTWTKSEEDNKKWAELCEFHIKIAKNLMEKGDTVLTAEGAMPQIRITISHFLEDPTTIRPYKNEPCFIMAYNPKYQSTGPTRYALHELDLSSIIKKETTNAE